MTPADATPVTSNSAPVERALFVLLKPFRHVHEGAEIDIHGVDMRALDVPDLDLLDQFQGKPIALIQHAIARLCDITVEQVQQLDLEDFGMLADEVIWQLREACEGMGLPLHLFAHPVPDEEGDDAVLEMLGMPPAAAHRAAMNPPT